MYIRRSKDALEVFWMSYVRPIYLLHPWGKSRLKALYRNHFIRKYSSFSYETIPRLYYSYWDRFFISFKLCYRCIQLSSIISNDRKIWDVCKTCKTSTRSILNIGGIGAFSRAHSLKKEHSVCLHPLKIFNENNFLETQGNRLGALVAPNLGRKYVLIYDGFFAKIVSS